MPTRIYEPRWHASQGTCNYQSRRTVDFAGHDLVLNSTLPKRVVESVFEAFEIKNDAGEFIGIVFSTPTTRLKNPNHWDYARMRNTRDWHAINTRYRRVKNARMHWGSKDYAVWALVEAEKTYWKNRRYRTVSPAKQMKIDQAMADIAAAFS